MNTQNTLNERSSKYGDYSGGTDLRTDIMNIICNRYFDINRKQLSMKNFIMIYDIINKLSRIAVTPDHEDSWQDIIGYSTLILKEIQNANK